MAWYLSSVRSMSYEEFGADYFCSELALVGRGTCIRLVNFPYCKIVINNTMCRENKKIPN